MSTVRHRDIDVPRSIVDGHPGHLDVSFEQHPSGALRATFQHHGRWEVDVAAQDWPVVERAYRDGDLVFDPPAYVRSLVRHAVRELRA